MQPNKDAQYGPPTSPKVRSAENARSVDSYVGPGLQIKGEITGNEDLMPDGKVEGLISIGGYRLSVGTTGCVVGEIVAREAVISGEVTGDINVCDRIEIKSSASVVGDLSTGKIMVEEGAYFKGAIETACNNMQIGTDLDSLLSRARKVEEK